MSKKPSKPTPDSDSPAKPVAKAPAKSPAPAPAPSKPAAKPARARSTEADLEAQANALLAAAEGKAPKAAPKASPKSSKPVKPPAKPMSLSQPGSKPSAAIPPAPPRKSADEASTIEELIDSVIEEAENDPSILTDSDLPDLPPSPRMGVPDASAGPATPAASSTKPAKPAAGKSARPGNMGSMLGAAATATGSAPVARPASPAPAAAAQQPPADIDADLEADFADDADPSDADHADDSDDAGDHPEAAAPGTPAPAKSNLLDLRPAALRDVKTSSQLYAERQSRFQPTQGPTVNPRKVRGGVKLNSKEGPVSLAWSAQRWLRLVEDCAPNENLAEGLIYARLGQTKTLITSPGLISAKVQGRLPFAYTTEIRLPTFTFQQWDQVLEAMVKEARPLAALLAGEVPQNIDDCFTQFRLHLFPAEPSHVSLACTCHRANAQAAQQAQSQFRGSASPQGFGNQRPPAPTGSPNLPPAPVAAAPSPAPSVPSAATAATPAAADASADPSNSANPSLPAAPATQAKPAPTPGASTSPWCKHICCVMALVAERLAHDPFLIFHLRGVTKDDLLERLRQKRAVSTPGRQSSGLVESAAVDHPVPVYQPQIAGVTDVVGKPLDQSVNEFWESGPELDTLELPVEPPAVSHPLLRRLGTSPFQGARFPLVGLLATCYETIGGKLLAPELPTLPAPAPQPATPALPPGPTSSPNDASGDSGKSWLAR